MPDVEGEDDENLNMNVDEDFGGPRRVPGVRFRSELWWMKRRDALLQCGYALRSRYQPDWVPSWQGTKKNYEDQEDGQDNPHRAGLDATRTSDGRHVMLKKVIPQEGPYELQINQLFASEPLASDPRNHCAQILEVIKLPGEDEEKLLVMPLLRQYDDPPFETYGEVVAFLSQLFEGVQFMNENNVAHRDCTQFNVMYDPSPMYADSYHPVETRRRRDWKGDAKYYTRTQRPPRYYLIDFGLSRRYNPADGPPLEMVLRGGDKSAPEHRSPAPPPCNPFPTDIYYLGNLIRENFLQKCYGFEFVEPLVKDMVLDDPEKRPKIDEVVSRFEEIRASLSKSKLRSRVVRRKEVWVVGMWRSVGYWYRRAGYFLQRKAAIPDP
ncbi:hypothetical protein BV25DRAFT_1581074 [Artomyces pyxidatus]|uniref:Uncharacterized protein n=1 Tax=Artomyces pyxidatus TaxID=48021 RepID=A0ACB8TBV6_9AGAM|nr:hypothetical protein BV25DRAFT_1581074 [Artomyces pyxidatus]